MGDRPHEKLARSGSCMLLYDDGAGAGGEVGLVGGRRGSAHSSPASLGVWAAGWGGGGRGASPQPGSLERGLAGPEIQASWLLHSPQLLPNRPRLGNAFKTKETNGDREGAVCAAEIKSMMVQLKIFTREI